MAVERILGTETGKSAFEKTDRNVVALDASLTADKLDLATHKAESGSRVMQVTRDISLIGQQIVTDGSGRKIKGLIISAYLNGTRATSYYIQSLSKAGEYIDNTDGIVRASSEIILSNNATANRVKGVVNIIDNNITVDWSVLNGSLVGTAYLSVLILYHGV